MKNLRTHWRKEFILNFDYYGQNDDIICISADFHYFRWFWGRFYVFVCVVMPIKSQTLVRTIPEHIESILNIIRSLMDAKIEIVIERWWKLSRGPILGTPPKKKRIWNIPTNVSNSALTKLQTTITFDLKELLIWFFVR